MRLSATCGTVMVGIVLAMVLIAGVPAMGAAAQTASGSISGRILNGSAGQEPVSGLSISLYQLSGSTKQLVNMRTSDNNGVYRFDGITARSDIAYIASVSFQGVTYTSSLTSLQSDTAATVDIAVYNSSTDGSGIAIDRLSIVPAAVDSKSGLITLVESYHLTNTAMSTYIGAASASQRQTLLFPLFPSARNLSPLSGFSLDDAVAVPGGFALTSPVLPGTSTISFTYDLPYQTPTLALRRQIAYQAALVEVILPEGVRISSPQLKATASVQLGGRSFNTVQAANLAANSQLELDLSGLASRPRRLLDLGGLPVQVTVVGFILAATATAVLYVRGRRAMSDGGALAEERSRLLGTIADLDDRAGRGELSAAMYRDERSAGLKRLAELTKQLQARSPLAAPDASYPGETRWPRRSHTSRGRPVSPLRLGKGESDGRER